MTLEAHRQRGSAFAATHLEDVISSWRTTTGQLKWVLNPGDPNQIDEELVMYVLAVYVAAMHSLIETKRGLNGNDAALLTASDGVDYMIDRAEEHPLIMVILLELRYAELTFMLHEAEKKSNCNLYRTAMKFLAPLFAGTHATKYVSMTVDFFVDWFCASDCDKIIFAKAIFTRKTKNGAKVFSDRFVEWMMRDLRMWLGKKANPHTDSLLAKVFGGDEVKSESAKTRKYSRGGEAA